MKTIVYAVFAFAFFLMLTDSSFATSSRVKQIPNGAKFDCANCHNNPDGGGSRNAFGREIENNYLDNNGNVIWGPALAALDSDGDGFSNGTELHDPNGNWKKGQANPGDIMTVFNPADASSKPAAGVLDYYTDYRATGIRLLPAYPNPSANGLTIQFVTENTANVSAAIYNAAGGLVRRFNDGFKPAGQYTLDWDGADAGGNAVVSGLYLLVLNYNGLRLSQKFTIAR